MKRFFLAASAATLFACPNARAPSFDPIVGLDRAIALVSKEESRVVMLRPTSNQGLSETRIDFGENLVASHASEDGHRFFLLTRGSDERNDGDGPALYVIDGASATLSHTFHLSIARDALALDPEGRYAVIYSKGVSQALVDNPNEILLVDLQAEISEENPRTLSLRSFGGRPQRLTFTHSLGLSGGARRLLVVESEKDLTLVDLARPADNPVTVRLEASNTVLVPEGVVVDDGDPNVDDDARIAVSLASSSAALILSLSSDANGAMAVRTNLIDLGGKPSQLAFLETDAGRRLVVLLSQQRKALLITPDSGVIQTVDLPGVYTSLVFTGGKPARSALLFGRDTALWALDQVSGRPFASIEPLQLPAPISQIKDIPGRDDKKVLVSTSQTFFVLDLAKREASPLNSQSSSLQFAFAPDHMWLYERNGSRAARVDFDSLHPSEIVFDDDIASMYDVSYTDGEAEQRSLIVLHRTSDGELSASIMDADSEDTKNARRFTRLGAAR
jgi:hypothetical protein